MLRLWVTSAVRALLLAAVAAATVRRIILSARSRAAGRLVADRVCHGRYRSGLWLLAISESRCAALRARLQKGFGSDKSPADLVRTLIAVRNVELMQHVEGPVFDSQVNANDWLDRLGPQLVGAGRRPPRSKRGKRVLALAYASAEAPLRSPTLSAIADYLEGALGTALVACPRPPARQIDGADDILRWLALCALAAALTAGIAPYFFGAAPRVLAATSGPAEAGNVAKEATGLMRVEAPPAPRPVESSSRGPSPGAADSSGPAPDAATPVVHNLPHSSSGKDAPARTPASPRPSH
jgi:hypothetical protein